MKLYATVNSERKGRPAKKGGDSFLDIVINRGNATLGTLRVYEVENNEGYKVHWHDAQWSKTELIDVQTKAKT